MSGVGCRVSGVGCRVSGVGKAATGRSQPIDCWNKGGRSRLSADPHPPTPLL
ncbi:MAG: AraC family transcriptional regulator [Leptolyngbyaceae cyanobacterium SM1_3_5]|nr:AraC family transcriptional regulator [Leptolyngbyaceae cyanobacterium SM1_3_5]